jgi:hypothetical protein
MPASWPAGVPHRLLRGGATYRAPDLVQRSQTDSGKARQRQVFTAADKVFAGNIRMTQAQLVTFIAWRDALGGGTFNWPYQPLTGALVEARFVAGEQAQPASDPVTPKWLVPVTIEVLA